MAHVSWLALSKGITSIYNHLLRPGRDSKNFFLFRFLIVKESMIIAIDLNIAKIFY
jgi:hypothetical protein